MGMPNKKFAIEKLCHVVEDAIPRLSSLTECDEMEVHVNRMYKTKLINLPRYNRWKKGIENARNLLNKGE